MTIIDFHSHILPGMDDGSKDIKTSLAMCEESVRQGVGLIVATPHFIAQEETIDAFLTKRTQAYEKLVTQIPERRLKILLGSEVAWFDGIDRAERLSALTIEGTKLLLIELPFDRWDQKMVSKLRILTEQYQVVLAHPERYRRVPGYRNYYRQIFELPVLLQINAGSLNDWQKRRTLINMFRDGRAQLLGSDCHGIEHRPPNLNEGREILRKKLGEEFLKKTDAFGRKLLGIDEQHE